LPIQGGFLDHDRFDDLARTLATGTSRRQALKLLGGSLTGGLLAALGVGTAVADECKRNGKPCKKDSQCCSGTCPNGTQVPLGQRYSCVCTNGEVQYCDAAGCSDIPHVQEVCGAACVTRGGVSYIRCEPGACVL